MNQIFYSAPYTVKNLKITIIKTKKYWINIQLHALNDYYGPVVTLRHFYEFFYLIQRNKKKNKKIKNPAWPAFLNQVIAVVFLVHLIVSPLQDSFFLLVLDNLCKTNEMLQKKKTPKYGSTILQMIRNTQEDNSK